MKKILLLFLGFILTCMSCSCSSTDKYYVRTPYNEVAEEKFESFDSLDEAKKKLEDVKQLGYVIYNSKGGVKSIISTSLLFLSFVGTSSSGVGSFIKSPHELSLAVVLSFSKSSS